MNKEYKLKSLGYDIQIAEDMVKFCQESIMSGNWEGYSENLAERKRALKRYKATLEDLKQQKRELE